MTPKHLYLLLIAVIGISTVVAQNEDELQIPVENDNQFPPDKHSDVIEGSGNGVIEEPEDTHGTTTETVRFPIEDIDTKVLSDNNETSDSDGDDGCPKPCVCRIEGSSSDFIVDCSGYNLTEFPTPINEKTTVLYLQKNKLTEIPKDISSLKHLKILNANDNSIATLASGSISELPELVTLKLENNRLIEYPHDLKNSFGLTKLEELYLGGNDMRTELTSDNFVKFESLRTIILPSTSSGSQIQKDLCEALLKSLETVCIQSCANQLYECNEDGEVIDGEMPVSPGMIADNTDDDDSDPVVNTPEHPKVDEKTETTKLSDDSATEPASKSKPQEFSFRSAVIEQQSDTAPKNSIVEAPKIVATTEPAVKVGATTSDTKTGGVDKSIIGLVVAGMVVIVAGITIKKNWTSIKKRFSSNSRTPTERNGPNTNGAAPEEVPLQDKSPV